MRYRNFCDFQDGGPCHLGFLKFLNFNRLSHVGGQSESPCQISSKLVKRLRRYGNLTVFQNGGRPPAWICCVRLWTTHDEHLATGFYNSLYYCTSHDNTAKQSLLQLRMQQLPKPVTKHTILSILNSH